MEKKVKEFFNPLIKLISEINRSEINYIYLIIFLSKGIEVRVNL